MPEIQKSFWQAYFLLRFFWAIPPLFLLFLSPLSTPCPPQTVRHFRSHWHLMSLPLRVQFAIYISWGKIDVKVHGFLKREEIVLRVKVGTYYSKIQISISIQRSASGKEHACWCRRHKKYGFDPCVRMIPWGREWHPTPVFLSGESHGQRSLAGYNL